MTDTILVYCGSVAFSADPRELEDWVYEEAGERAGKKGISD